MTTPPPVINYVFGTNSIKDNNAKCVVLVIHKDDIPPDGGKLISLPFKERSFKNGLEGCPDPNRDTSDCILAQYDQQSSGSSFGTGFLINNKVVTAAHVILQVGKSNNTDIEDLRFIRNFTLKGDAELQVTFSVDDILAPVDGQDVIGNATAYSYSGNDVSIIAIEPKENMVQLSIEDVEQTPENGTQVYILGHPFGLPLKIAEGELTNILSDRLAEADLKTYGGNSGSPVFSNNGKLIGFLIKSKVRGKCPLCDSSDEVIQLIDSTILQKLTSD